MAQVLASILSRLIISRDEQQWVNGIEQTDQALKEHIGLTYSELLDIPDDTFIDTLQSVHSIDRDSLERIADILLLIGDENSKNQPMDDEKRVLYNKCLLIYEHINGTGKLYSLDARYKIDRIHEVLSRDSMRMRDSK
ncbi:hypothetical protein [Rhodohalobacter sp. SW132]